VVVPTEAELDAIQNENFFEGDIAGIPVDGGSVRLADAPYDVFSEPVNLVGASCGLGANTILVGVTLLAAQLTQPCNLPRQTLGGRSHSLHAGRRDERRVGVAISKSVAHAEFRQRAAIAQAFDEYKEKTCVRFLPREDADFDYIYIKRNQAFG
jgi:hypothetical protein